MDWNNLMSKKRLCQDVKAKEYSSRTEYQKDYDRIVFSSPFRRLQDKAQVFPLSDNDYVRTRLTHSLEVSCVGRSLGSMVGEKIIEKYGIKDLQPTDFATVTSTACLAHDIGNTPLGHSGEFAIREWFKKSELGKSVINSLRNEQQKNDFLNYQGNAQGFRYLSKLQWPSESGGLQLTCAVLGSFLKYPCSSSSCNADSRKKLSKFYDKKFSFFCDDADMFFELVRELGLSEESENVMARHPLAFLVEAADDICYHIIDVEDGHRLGQISFEEAQDLLLHVLDKAKAEKRIRKMENKKDKIECLRAMAIFSLIQRVSKVFIDNIDAITEGGFCKELTKCIDCAGEFLKLKTTAEEKVYTARKVVEIEVAGYSVVEKLLEFFLYAVEEKYSKEYNGDKMSPRSRSVLQLLPESFVGKGKMPSPDPYCRALRVVDYISGMTDSFAVSVFKKLSGILL